LLTGRPGASAGEGIEWVVALCDALGIRPLRTFGLGEADAPVLCEKADTTSSMKGNPIALTAGELREILLRAL
jgi:alcohol dehydrogenase class IV